MHNNDLIRLPIGKILILRKNERKQFWKVEEDNTLTALNEEEIKYINNIFNLPKGEIIYSETALEVGKNNEHFKGRYDYWLPIIEEIDSQIPEEAKQHFYRNLSTLKTEITENNSNNRTSEIMVCGGYNIIENKISIPAEFINDLKYAEQQGMIEDFELEYLNSIIHEMLHAASSEYDKENGILKSGLEQWGVDGTYKSSNRGLTEGITEVLTERITKKLYGKTPKAQEICPYKKEKLIAKQLQMFCPSGIMEGYFKAEGCQELKDSMKTYYKAYDNPEAEVEKLFERIEDSFRLIYYEQEDNFQSTIPIEIQNSLLTALESKIEQDLQNGTLQSLEEVEIYLEIYGKNLLTPENLHLKEGEQNKFPDLQTVSERFGKIKEEYKQKVIGNEQKNSSINESQHISEEENVSQIHTEKEAEISKMGEKNVTLQEVEQATENVTISSIENEKNIAEKVIEAPVIQGPIIE